MMHGTRFVFFCPMGWSVVAAMGSCPAQRAIVARGIGRDESTWAEKNKGLKFTQRWARWGVVAMYARRGKQSDNVLSTSQKSYHSRQCFVPFSLVAYLGAVTFHDGGGHALHPFHQGKDKKDGYGDRPAVRVSDEHQLQHATQPLQALSKRLCTRCKHRCRATVYGCLLEMGGRGAGRGWDG